jgi:hypothetical protein
MGLTYARAQPARPHQFAVSTLSKATTSGDVPPSQRAVHVVDAMHESQIAVHCDVQVVYFGGL